MLCAEDILAAIDLNKGDAATLYLQFGLAMLCCASKSSLEVSLCLACFFSFLSCSICPRVYASRPLVIVSVTIDQQQSDQLSHALLRVMPIPFCVTYAWVVADVLTLLKA